MATPSINYVPIDVVLEIMVRLPVKSLMRLRLISKSLFSFTAAPNFVTSHLALSRSSGYVALPSRFLNPPPSSIAILDKSFNEVLRPEIPFSFSPRSESEFRVECIYSLVGSCNGLLCVTDNRRDYLGRVVVLWNPMIGKFKSISDTCLNSNTLHDPSTRITLGFGFDEKNDDYKIIRIVTSEYENESSAQAEIYSLKTDSWRKLNFPINYVSMILLMERYSYRCSFIHGALHWLVFVFGESEIISRNNLVIFSFKIDDEKFKVTRLPQSYIRANPFCSLDLMVLKKSLALTMIYQVMEDEVVKRCRIWKMKNYEEVEYWTEKRLPITQVEYIYGFTEDGGLMFTENDFEVSLYNHKTGTLKESFMVDAESIVLFRESLVLL